jgi:hypothetical protein
MYAMIALVVANLVVGVVCRLAAPRAWGRQLCLAAIVITALPLLWIVKVIAENAHLKESTAGVYALPVLLLLVELVWLIAVYLAAYVRRTTPPPK